MSVKWKIMLTEISETSLDVRIPSYPGSPRSIDAGSEVSLLSIEDRDEQLKEAIDFLHYQNIFMEAAEIGNDKLLSAILSKQQVNIQQLDQLGRNALHLAVCAGNEHAVTLLLEAGINPSVKDNLGMTPLSLCLMRQPSVRVANLLFDHGATIRSRGGPMDTGLFIQFVMMCIPTEEDEKLLELLVRKGALVNDPDAPGGRQALHIAAMSNNCRLINKLVFLGANTHMKNCRGETPKEFAAIFKCKEAIALLELLDDNDYPSTVSRTPSETSTTDVSPGPTPSEELLTGRRLRASSEKQQ